jgi:SPX domain protein involved in polyphosphate accumulation
LPFGTSERGAIVARLQASRYEMKYIVSESTARFMKDFVLTYLQPDEHSRPEQKYGYPVRSLYLDTRHLSLYRQTVRGIKNRFKLRIRFYDDNPAHPVFMEIKRRQTDVIRKQRAAVTREAARRFLSGFDLTDDDLMYDNADERKLVKSFHAMRDFCYLKKEILADASLYVCYYREAFVSKANNTLRVTFDRDVRACPYFLDDSLFSPGRGVATAIPGVILEIKFTNQYPGWINEMVRQFQIQRRSVPKYIECIDAALFRHGFDGVRCGGILTRARVGAL